MSTKTETPEQMKARAHALRVQADQLGLATTEGWELLQQSNTLYRQAREADATAPVRKSLPSAATQSRPHSTAPARAAAPAPQPAKNEDEAEAYAKAMRKAIKLKRVEKRAVAVMKKDERKEDAQARTLAALAGTPLPDPKPKAPKLLTLEEAAGELKLRPDQVASQLKFWPISPTTDAKGMMHLRSDEVERCRPYAKTYRDYKRHLVTI